MKKILFSTIIIVCVFSTIAQNNKISYQAVLRNSANELVYSENVKAVVEIVDENNNVQYSENHQTTTNANGMLSLMIGTGTNVDGDFSFIVWKNASIRSKFTLSDNTELIQITPVTAVPYAYYAENAFSGDYNDLTNKPNIPVVPSTISSFTNDAGYITASEVPTQQIADWNATSGVTQILNKPTIPTVPTNVSSFTNDSYYVSNANCQDVNICDLVTTINQLQQKLDELQDIVNNLNVSTSTVPTVSTSAVSSITNISAICGGNVTDDGGESVTERGICWSTSANPTISNNKTSNQIGTGTFAANMTGLTENTTYYVRAYATNSKGTAYGEQKTFKTLSLVEVQACQGTPTVTDKDGNVYNTVQIGTQCWMRENLKTKKYADGTSIPEKESGYQQKFYYPLSGNNGYLYNWPAMANTTTNSSVTGKIQGVCPNGWHIPTLTELTTLIEYLGTNNDYVCQTTSSTTIPNIGKSLASTLSWSSSLNSCAIGNDKSSNNKTGFSALPAGYYGFAASSGYQKIGEVALFWYIDNAGTRMARSFMFDNAQYGTMSTTASNAVVSAASVRCIKND